MAEDLKNLIIELINEIIQYEQRISNMLRDDLGHDELPDCVFGPADTDFNTRVNQALAKRAIQIEMSLVMTILNTSILDSDGRPKPEFLDPTFDYYRHRQEATATPGTSWDNFEATPGTSRDYFEATPGTSWDNFEATPGTSRDYFEATPGTSWDHFEATPGTSRDMNEATSDTSRNSELQETPGNPSGTPEPEAYTDSD